MEMCCLVRAHCDFFMIYSVVVHIYVLSTALFLLFICVLLSYDVFLKYFCVLTEFLSTNLTIYATSIARPMRSVGANSSFNLLIFYEMIAVMRATAYVEIAIRMKDARIKSLPIRLLVWRSNIYVIPSLYESSPCIVQETIYEYDLRVSAYVYRRSNIYYKKKPVHNDI